MSSPHTLTITQITTRLGISAVTVRSRIREGVLVAIPGSRPYLVTLDSYKAYADAYLDKGNKRNRRPTSGTSY